MQPTEPEPWLRGTHQELPAALRAVVHALELAREDLDIWCAPLTDAQLNLELSGNASVAFQLRHISRSLDRLLTYAEGRALTEAQLEAKRSESAPGANLRASLEELHAAIDHGIARVSAFATANLEAPRFVGRENLHVSLAGLIVHVADHTQRHAGQAITTAKFVSALGNAS